MLDKSSSVAYISLAMTEKDPENLGREVAEAMVSAVLAASPRLDTFSTWLMWV